MKYNLSTLKVYFKRGRKFKFFGQIGLKYREIVFKYWEYILNTLKPVSKYISFSKVSYWTNEKEKLSFFVFVYRDRIYGLFSSVGQTAFKSHCFSPPWINSLKCVGIMFRSRDLDFTSHVRNNKWIPMFIIIYQHLILYSLLGILLSRPPQLATLFQETKADWISTRKK